MGRIFLEQMSSPVLFDCRICRTNLSSIEELRSTTFMGETGMAYLFDRVINVVQGDLAHRNFTTGFHHVRDVTCKRCGVKVGWYYEYAKNPSQQYKERHTVLEYSLLRETTGIGDENVAYIFFEDDEF